MATEREEIEKPIIDLKSSTFALAHRRGLRNQILVIGAIFLSCIVGGAHIAVPSVLLPQLLGLNTTDVSNEIPLDVNMGSWIASVFVVTTPMGAFLSGPMSDFLGRRNTLIIAMAPMLISWCVMALAQSYHVLLLSRLISGLSIGIVGGPIQIYIAEVSDPKLRGTLNCVLATMYTIGILLANVAGAKLHWRVLSWMFTILTIVSIIPLFLIPESPSWLYRNKKTEKAFKALKMLRGHETIAEEELKTMQKRLTEENATSDVKENIFQLCSQRAAYKPLTIVSIFVFLHLFTGNFVLISYASDFLEEIGSTVDINTPIIGMGISRNICTILFCGVILVRPLRTIVLASGISSSITSLLISIFLYARIDQDISTMEGYLYCFSLIIYVLFNTPLMIIPGILIGELLPARIRGRLAGYVYTMMNVSLFGIIKWFPYMQNAFKLRGVFLFFTLANIACTVFMYLFQPNTTGLTLNEIEDYFDEDNWLWSKRDKTYKQVKQADFSVEKS